MMGDLSQSLEDYLEAIYISSKKHSVVRVKDLTQHLEVKNSSVVGALKTLAKNGLVRHEHYGYIELTEKGRKAAEQIYEKHRIISHFLHKILGVSEEIADQDACALEHRIHPETYERILKLFEFLENCPTEEPTFVKNFHHFLNTGRIPNCLRSKPEEPEKPQIHKKLSELRAGEKGRIIKITANPKSRKHLLSLGLIRGEIIDVLATGERMDCRIKESRLSLETKEAESILVAI